MPDLDVVRRSAGRWRWVLGLSVLAMITLVWTAWAESTTHERRQAIAAAAHRQGNLAVAVGHYLTRALGNADAVAQFLAAVHAMPDSDFPRRLQERASANNLFSEMALCDQDGSVLSSRPARDPAELAQWCAHWLRQAPAGARTYPAPAVLGSGRSLVPILTRVAATEARPAGVIVLLVEVRGLLGLMQDYSIAEETVVLVAGDDGQARARWHSVTAMAQQRAPEVGLLAQVLAAGTLGQPKTVEGRPILATVRKVQAYPLVVFVGTSIPDTLAAPENRSGYYAAACGVATLLIAAFALLLLYLQNQATARTESLARARQRLKLLNEGLEGEVRARTGELEAAYGDLEAFSYTVAHDVRAPIAAILGFAEALAPAVQASGDTRSAHYLKRIKANAAQMSEFTEALLELGKLSRAPVATTRVDISAMAHEVLAGLREREGTPRSVQTQVQEGISAQGDRVLLRQVLENLFGNAWKFSAARTPAVITLEARRADDWMQIAVRDNGEGFDPAEAADVFRPFCRLHAAGDFAGTGVGLATVERILRLHGGRAWIESSPAGGTTVFFTLPADGAAA
ncbi:MAG: hypothetical protein JWP41_2982 [Ramlibacter sp.]|nr:hypothetical protein [Ramlibacter sp.]